MTSTPRPVPQFFTEINNLSTKKSQSRSVSRLKAPRAPRTPLRPYLSKAPHGISFNGTESIVDSTVFDAGKHEIVLTQCFDIMEKLGEGSFGVVYKVKSKEDGNLYAIKRSQEPFKNNADRKRRLAEVQKHECLPSHENCVKLIKAWEENDLLYIQTELCSGNLAEFADENHEISEDTIWDILTDLLLAVQHFHSHELVHMDIKPENIFISSDQQCYKLGDFGLAIDLVALAEAKAPTIKRRRPTHEISLQDKDPVEGDAKYMAPELLEGNFGKPADIFSLGMTVLELAADLDLPQNGETWHKLRSGEWPTEIQEIPQFAALSDELKSILSRMINPDPVLRPTVDEVLAMPEVQAAVKKKQPKVIATATLWEKFCKLFIYMLNLLAFSRLFFWRTSTVAQNVIHLRTARSANAESVSQHTLEPVNVMRTCRSLTDRKRGQKSQYTGILPVHSTPMKQQQYDDVGDLTGEVDLSLIAPKNLSSMFDNMSSEDDDFVLIHTPSKDSDDRDK